MDFNTDIDTYSIAELLIILNMNDVEARDPVLIRDRVEPFLEKYKSLDDKKMFNFFKDIQTTLVNYAEELEEGDEDYSENTNLGKQANEFITNAGALPQNNEIQADKITDRFQQVEVFANNHVPMEQTQLGVNNVKNVEVAQDGKLNPTLSNTTTRMVVIDSFFRQESSNNVEVSTDYTLDLSDRLSRVLSLRLYSVQIPMTFYVIDDVYGNTCFWITNEEQNIPISIPPANYTPTSLVDALNLSFTTAGFTDVSVEYDSSTFKITLLLDGGLYTPPPDSSYTGFSLEVDTTFVTFYNPEKPLECNTTCIPQALKINETLGYLMGFQSQAQYQILEDGNVAESVVNLYGPRYLVLMLDDFAQNHLNNGLVTITEPSKLVKLPDYYTTDHPFICEEDNQGNQVPQLVQSGPRTLTQNQLYTINEIMKNNANNLDTRSKAPTTTNVLAVIPLKNQNRGSIYVDFSGQLQENKRTYFGPVDIERMRIKLLDDKGNTLNLNGANWSFTLLSENLYQY